MIDLSVQGLGNEWPANEFVNLPIKKQRKEGGREEEGTERKDRTEGT